MRIRSNRSLTVAALPDGAMFRSLTVAALIGTLLVTGGCQFHVHLGGTYYTDEQQHSQVEEKKNADGDDLQNDPRWEKL